jgi:hypothetical protein
MRYTGIIVAVGFHDLNGDLNWAGSGSGLPLEVELCKYAADLDALIHITMGID